MPKEAYPLEMIPAREGTPTSSAIGTASPLASARDASKACAMSLPSRTKSRYPGGAYRDWESEATSLVVSGEPMVPAWMAFSGMARNRKPRPSGRNSGKT
jgi:hypothetical protein